MIEKEVSDWAGIIYELYGIPTWVSVVISLCVGVFILWWWSKHPEWFNDKTSDAPL
jgi:uncharacterized membrane protein YkvI